MNSGFWQRHSTKAFALLFVLLSALIVFLDFKAAGFLGLGFEEEIAFPAIGILFLGFGLLALRGRVSGKAGLLAKWRNMGIASKLFGLLSLLLILAAVILAVFEDLSLFSLNSTVIAEERVVAIAMLFSILVFLYIHSKEVLAVKPK